MHKSWKISTRPFSVNLASGELPKYVWTVWQTVTFLDVYIVKMRPELFHKACTEVTSTMRLNFTTNSFIFGCKNHENAPRTFFINLIMRKLPKWAHNFFLKLARRKLPKYVWTSQQTASFFRFETHESWKFAQNFLCKPRRWTTSKMRLNFAANSFAFRRINRKNALKTLLINLAKRKLPKCVWTSQQTASHLDA